MDTARVGQTIAYLRRRAGFTQRTLAERIGISDKAVSKWERGLSLPDIAYLGKLAVLLDTDAESILAGDAVHHDKGWGGLLVLEDTPDGIGAGTVIYDKPLVYYLLSYFLLAGVRRIVVSCGPKDAEFIASEFGGGGALGISLSCVDHNVLTCAHASGNMPKKLPDKLDCDNVMVVYGRSFLYGAGITRLFQRAMANKDRTTVLAMPRTPRDNSVGLCFDGDKKIIHASSNTRLNTQYNYYQIPIMFRPRLSFGAPLASLPAYADTADRGYIEHPIDTWDDVADVSNLVRVLQKSSGMVVYCLEEIAWRRGLIGAEELKAIAMKKCDSYYGKYLLCLCK